MSVLISTQTSHSTLVQRPVYTVKFFVMVTGKVSCLNNLIPRQLPGEQKFVETLYTHENFCMLPSHNNFDSVKEAYGKFNSSSTELMHDQLQETWN